MRPYLLGHNFGIDEHKHTYPSEEDQKMAARLRAASEPLLEFFDEMCGPYDIIVIRQRSIELFRHKAIINI